MSVRTSDEKRERILNVLREEDRISTSALQERFDVGKNVIWNLRKIIKQEQQEVKP